jgi:protein disulfide-isomerase A1
MQWCHVCRTFKAEYERCKGLAAASGLEVEFAMINAEDEDELKQRFNLDFYPSFKLFRDGLLEDNTGGAPLTGEGVIAGLNQALGRPRSTFARSLSTVDEARSWLFNRGRPDLSMLTTVVGFFPPGVTDEAALATFEGAAESLSGKLRFARMDSVDLITAFSMPLDRVSLVLYKDFDEGKEVYTGELTPEDLQAWTYVRNRPLATVMNTHNIRQLQTEVPAVVHVFTNTRGAEEGRSKLAYLSALRAVGMDVEAEGLCARGQIIYTLVDGEKYPNWMEVFGLDPSELPAFAVANTKDSLFYSVPGVQGTLPTDTELPEINSAALHDMVQRYFSGLLVPQPQRRNASS